MKNKTSKTKSKPVDTKPKPPVRKPAKKATKTSKARYNQPGTDIKDNARGAVKTLRSVATGILLMKLHAQINGKDTVLLPRDLVDAALDIFAEIELDIIRKAGLEDDFVDINDLLNEDEEE